MLEALKQERIPSTLRPGVTMAKTDSCLDVSTGFCGPGHIASAAVGRPSRVAQRRFLSRFPCGYQSNPEALTRGVRKRTMPLPSCRNCRSLRSPLETLPTRTPHQSAGQYSRLHRMPDPAGPCSSSNPRSVACSRLRKQRGQSHWRRGSRIEDVWTSRTVPDKTRDLCLAGLNATYIFGWERLMGLSRSHGYYSGRI